jgi:putative membrane protein
MISNYVSHAANERTYLAWLRTGLAVVAFGFVVQKVTVPTPARSVPTTGWASIDSLIGTTLSVVGRYDGVALIVVGIAILLLGGLRFVRTAREIESPTPRTAGMRIELLLSGGLAVLAAMLCAYVSIA